MIDAGAMVGDGSCGALGPTAVIPAGMSRQRYHADVLASLQAGRRFLLHDPAAEAINTQVLNSPEMAAAIGAFLQQVDQPLAATLARQAPKSGEPLAARIGAQLIHDHPLRFVQTATRTEGVGGIAIGALLLGLPTNDLPATLRAMHAAGKEMRIALDLAQHVFAVDPLAEVMNAEPAPSFATGR